VPVDKREPKTVYMALDSELAVADDVDKLLDRVSERLLGSVDVLTPAVRADFRAQLLRTSIDVNRSASATPSRSQYLVEERRKRVTDAIYLIATSPDYAAQR
jgi:hypothetical protein